MSKTKVSLRDMFLALTVKNYRMYFAGQGISLIGTWMQRTTMGWFVYRITGSALLLGLIGFLSQIPAVFIGPFAGVWADRWNRLTIIKVTQTASLLQATILAILVITNNIQIWHLIVLSLMQGVIESIDAPARQAFVLELVQKRSLLTNAIALNSAMFNGARLIGPSLAGIIIAVSNEGYCFLLNGLSYLAVILTLFLIKVPIREYVVSTETMLTKIKAGWQYAFTNMPIRFLLSNIAVATMFGMSYATLMPIFARDILKGDAKTLGYIMSMAGVGALCGAMYLAAQKSIAALGKKMVYALMMLSVTLIVFSYSTVLAINLGLMLLIGLGMMFQMATSNTILQTVVDDKMRGRVMSLHSMTFMTFAPFGSLLAGFLSKHFGAPNALRFGAIVCLIWAGYSLVNLKKFIQAVNSMLKKHDIDLPPALNLTDIIPAVSK